ncbi:MAG: HNH endonuclease [Symploca sp. SIO1B1]|nr:HNH endonuclease [Symploca sp. SIO1C2]NER94510.1 HNH endonuclease [Symploca sp. SIO1B1]
MSSLNKKSLRAQVININTGEVSIKQIPMEHIVTRSQSISKLTDSQISRVTRLYEKVGYLVSISIEKWIEGFTYDLHPEQEIKVWEIISAVFEDYNIVHNLNVDQKQEIIKKLIFIVGGEKLNDSVSLELNKLLKAKKYSKFWVDLSQLHKSWKDIDYQMLAQIYTEYCKRHPVVSQSNKDEIFVTIIRLMEGNETSSELSQELLEIRTCLEQSQSNNEQYFNPDDTSDERQKRLRDVVTRPGQAKFRSDLMKAYGGCCSITGCSVEDVLQAAHIIPYLGKRTNHPSNGILLRVDIHKLFDSHKLSINPDTKKVEISPILHDTCYEELAGKLLRIPKSKTERPNYKALSKHYQTFYSS